MCGSGWTLNGATVVCKQLGFPGAIKALSGVAYGKILPDEPVWWTGLGCQGNERSVSACTGVLSSLKGNHTCELSSAAGVICEGEAASLTLCTFRVYFLLLLVFSSDSSSFSFLSSFIHTTAFLLSLIFLLFYSHVFLCGSFSILSSSSFCLPLPPPPPLLSPLPFLPIHLLHCSLSIAFLPLFTIPLTLFLTSLSLDPTATPPRVGTLRLVDNSTINSSSAGRLEIFFNGKWGTICQDFWKEKNTLVACKQLGFAGAIRSFR